MIKLMVKARLTLTGWTQSATNLWVRHQLKKVIERQLLTMCRVLAVKDNWIWYW